MKSKTQKYFRSMKKRYFFNHIPNHFETNLTHMHKMSMEEQVTDEDFEERVYLENEAFSHFCDFINKE